MLAAWCLVMGAHSGAAQARVRLFDATSLREPADLSARWLLYAGDDPAFAQPDYDDSKWAVFDPHTDLKSVYGTARPQVVWYRLHVKMAPDQIGLALREVNLSRAFEVYISGERLLASGRVAPFAPSTMGAQLLAQIPDRMVARGSMVIALRVHISPTEWAGQNPGLYANNLSIGQYATLYRYDWLAVIGNNALAWLDKLMLIGLGLVALVVYIAQRRQPEYLWIAAISGLALAQTPEPFAALFYSLPLGWEFANDLLRLFSPFLWASLYFAFVHQRIGWRWRTYLAAAGALNVFSAMNGVFFTVPLGLQVISNLPFILLLSVVVPIVLAVHWRRGNREAGILLIPVVLFSLYIYAEIAFGVLFQFARTRDMALRGLNFIDRYPAGPFAISLDNISGILSTVSLALIMLLRSATQIRLQTLYEGELAAAQEVQQALVPEHSATVPGFTVESIYEPAEQVGGDFFQVIPASDGGLLVVVGDVAGHGLPAAMLVSAIVGIVRGVAAYVEDPAELLANLNERLVGRAGDAFATALAARIGANGVVAIANAGHLSPYLDGREIELDGALPLGVVRCVSYETRRFKIESGGRLTFYSDGVIEAQSAHGELFGFERGRELSVQPAAEIVAAAKNFGQQDDITVVTIERAAAVASAA